jgi:hypothetical protein
MLQGLPRTELSLNVNIALFQAQGARDEVFLAFPISSFCSLITDFSDPDLDSAGAWQTEELASCCTGSG